MTTSISWYRVNNRKKILTRICGGRGTGKSTINRKLKHSVTSGMRKIVCFNMQPAETTDFHYTYG